MADDRVQELARYFMNLGVGYTGAELLAALAIAAAYCIDNVPQEQKQTIFDGFCQNLMEIIWLEDGEDAVGIQGR